MEDNALNRLEEKIRTAVQELERLRVENRRLAAAPKGGSKKGAAAASNVESELRLLQNERAAVRTRIEGLIEWMEAAS